MSSGINIQSKLREAVQKLRRTPMPISDISPLLTQSADRIDALERRVAELESQKADWK